MTPDRELLRCYAETKDEAAFTELVQRHLPLVYGAAWRLTGGQAQSAQDVAQSVFATLAVRAGALTGHDTLAGWLHTTTRNFAHKWVRGERRRRAREQEAAAMHDHNMGDAAIADSLQPLLDEAVGRLGNDERNALLLRFFEGMSHREAAGILGIAENTANKRVERALEKLRQHFARRGVTTFTALLATALEAQAAIAPPAGLGAQVAGASFAKAASAGALPHLFWKTFLMSTKTKILLTVAAMLALAAIPLAMQQQQISALKADASKHDASFANETKGAATTSATTPDANLNTLKSILALKDPLDMMLRLTTLVRGLDAASIRPLLDYLVQTSNAGRSAGLNNSPGELALSMLVDRLVKLAPQVALQWAAAVPNRLGHNALVAIVFADWANANPAQALAEAGDITDPRLKQQVIGQIVQSMIVSDPQGALAALAKMPLNATYTAALGEAFAAWAAQDPKAAMAAAMALPADRNRTAALQSVMQGWAAADPQGLLAWAGPLADGVTRNQAITLALSTLSRQDPQQALDFVASVANVPTRNTLTIKVVSDWALDDPQAASAWALANMNGDALKQAETAVMDPLSKLDPQAAVDLLGKMIAGGGNRINSVTQISQNWAELDPQADLNWLRFLDDASGNGTVSAVKSGLEVNAITAWARNDPDAAMAYVSDLGTGYSQYSKLLAAIGSARAALDPAAATAWLQTLPDDATRAVALDSVATQLIKTDPEQAFALAQTMEPGPTQTTIFGKVIGTWSASDPVAAAASLGNLPPGPALVSATQSVAANWIQADPAAAGQWINTLPTGEARDGAAKEVVKALTSTDVSSAFTWAMSISDVTVRTQQARGVVQVWGRANPTAAAAAVQAATGLTDLGKTRLLAQIQRFATPGAAATTDDVAP